MGANINCGQPVSAIKVALLANALPTALEREPIAMELLNTLLGFSHIYLAAVLYRSIQTALVGTGSRRL